MHASWLVVYDGRTEIARHERLIGKARTRVELDHYLEALVRKPGALAGATALEQARQAGKFTTSHDAWWAAVRKAHGERDGTRAMIEVLLLHRSMPHGQVVAGLEAALRAGALTADAVALEARKAAETVPQLRHVVDLDEPEPDPVPSLTRPPPGATTAGHPAPALGRHLRLLSGIASDGIGRPAFLVSEALPPP
ncbi:hypothetical protein [Nocardia wallacei]|uniref:hypothetical protein n=1 Tax=Nocardia wallacei TaxID=480035 RepID=UPI002456E301|nr:hypothetical protein [Nocardia wallacei]